MPKDTKIAPGAEKDWLIDWASYLQDGESIVSHTATVAGGLEKISDTLDGTKVVVWVRGPTTLTIGVRCSISIAIVTSEGRKDSRRIELVVGRGSLVDLQAEAAWLATRSTADRADYLFEVAHCASRGPDEAERLQRLIGELSKSSPQLT